MYKLTTKELMHLAWLELSTERDRCRSLGIPFDGLQVNGVDLVDVLRNHLDAMP